MSTKPKVAFFDFTSCEGCQLTAIDALQTYPDLLEAVEIIQFREAMSEKGQDYQIAFVEGACSQSIQEKRLKEIRQQAQYVVALGACAHLGGVNSLRNWQPQEQVRRYVYGEMGKLQEDYPAQPIEAVIPIDAFIPGCPIDRDEFANAVKAFLKGHKPIIPDYPVCVECRLRENICVFMTGQVCLGPITRAGCKAICPTFGRGCDGCRGMITSPNLEGIKIALYEHGLSEGEFTERVKLFQSYWMKSLANQV